MMGKRTKQTNKRREKKEYTYSPRAPPNGSQEKKNAPKNAPMKIQIMIYPLKYIASNIMKYATANWSMCNVARTNCSKNVGRIGPVFPIGAMGGMMFAFAFGVECFASALVSSDEDSGPQQLAL